MNSEPLQSSSDASAAQPDVLEPVRRMLEDTGSGPVKRKFAIALYCDIGWFGGTAKRPCDKCEETWIMLTEIVRALGAEKAVSLHMRPLWMAGIKMIFKGERKHPILEINGKVYASGIVPDREKLKNHLKSLLIY